MEIERDNIGPLVAALGVTRIVLDLALREPPAWGTRSVLEPVHERRTR